MKCIELTDILRQIKKNKKEKNKLPGGWVKDRRDIDIINHIIIPHPNKPIPLSLNWTQKPIWSPIKKILSDHSDCPLTLLVGYIISQ